MGFSGVSNYIPQLICQAHRSIDIPSGNRPGNRFPGSFLLHFLDKQKVENKQLRERQTGKMKFRPTGILHFYRPASDHKKKRWQKGKNFKDATNMA
jgi:hypothetical protein